MSIRLLITGGTFDKEYDELTGRLFFGKRTSRKCCGAAAAVSTCGSRQSC